MEQHEALNLSLKLLCKRGQAQSRNIESILIKKYPSMNRDTAAEIIAESIGIVDSAIQLASKEFRKETTREAAVNEIRERWPMIAAEILEEVYAHAWLIAVR